MIAMGKRLILCCRSALHVYAAQAGTGRRGCSESLSALMKQPGSLREERPQGEPRSLLWKQPGAWEPSLTQRAVLSQPALRLV